MLVESTSKGGVEVIGGEVGDVGKFISKIGPKEFTVDALNVAVGPNHWEGGGRVEIEGRNYARVVRFECAGHVGRLVYIV